MPKYRPCYEYISGGGTQAFVARTREEAVMTIDDPLQQAILLARAEHDPTRPQRVAGKIASWFQWAEEVK